jgi:hypothetical protein
MKPEPGTGDQEPLAWPAVTALCPTYRRPERLRDAVACFLWQDYPGERRLLILNDAPEPVHAEQLHHEGRGGRAGHEERRAEPGCERLCGAAALGCRGLCGAAALGCEIRIVNAPRRYPTLGHKRQALLEMARTPLVAHWDDDDIYLPWHLTMLATQLTSRNPEPETRNSKPRTSCAKPRCAWYGVGPPGAWQLRGIRHNIFEGQMVFRRERALELGGYAMVDSGQARALLEAFRRAGELHTWEPRPWEVSYVYRWGDGLRHVSAAAEAAVVGLLA